MKLNQVKILSSVIRQNTKSSLKETIAEAPKYVNYIKDEIIYKKATELNGWYTRVIGLDEVRLYQERVVTLQEKLLSAQEKRRNIGQELTEIRKKSNELQDQIHKVKRQENLQQFLDLMKEETEILKLERDVSSNFNECDREEREIFTAFTNAVRDSHEKQRAQVEYTKYFGLVLGIFGSFLTFCYTTIRNRDLKYFIESHSAGAGGLQVVLKQIQENQKEFKNVIKYINDENMHTINLINSNHKDLLHVLRNSSSTIRSQPTNFNKVNSGSGEKLIFYGSVALLSFIVIRAFC